MSEIWGRNENESFLLLELWLAAKMEMESRWFDFELGRMVPYWVGRRESTWIGLETFGPYQTLNLVPSTYLKTFSLFSATREGIQTLVQRSGFIVRTNWLNLRLHNRQVILRDRWILFNPLNYICFVLFQTYFKSLLAMYFNIFNLREYRCWFIFLEKQSVYCNNSKFKKMRLTNALSQLQLPSDMPVKTSNFRNLIVQVVQQRGRPKRATQNTTKPSI